MKLVVKTLEGGQLTKVVDICVHNNFLLIQEHTLIAAEHDFRRNDGRLSLLRMGGYQHDFQLAGGKHIGPVAGSDSLDR